MPDASNPQLPMNSADVPSFRLLDWTVFPALNRITCGQLSESIEPRMMHVLVCLAATPGQVLSRRLLLETVWADVVVGEEALTRAISRLRLLLQDDKATPRFIETIRGGGYRLLTTPSDVSETTPDATPQLDTAGAARIRRHSRTRVVLLTLLVFAILVVGGKFLRQPTPISEGPWDPEPITTYQGAESFPAISPDGQTIAFYWSGSEAQNGGLFLKQMQSDQPLRLTDGTAFDYAPAFSPDGGTIAFVRHAEGTRSLRTIPSLGGADRQLAEVSDIIFGLDWSPLGDQLVFAGQSDQTDQFCIQSLDLATLEIRPLTNVDTHTHTGDTWPAFSADGSTVAFARCDHAGLRDVWTVAATGGPGTRLTEGLNTVEGLTWLPSGQELIVAAAPNGRLGLWKVRLSDGRYWPLRIGLAGRITHPSVSPDGSMIVFQHATMDFNIHRLDLVNTQVAQPPLLTFAASTLDDERPVFSPDGTQVAFVSDRSGQPNIWVAPPTGAMPRRLTDWQGLDIKDIFWAPDSRQMAVNVMDDLHAWIEIVDVPSATSAPFKAVAENERCCGWTEDGSALSLIRDLGPAWYLFQVRIDGSGETACDLELAGHPTIHGNASGYYYVHMPPQGLWFLPASGHGPGQLLIRAETFETWRSWQLTPTGLSVVRSTPNKGAELVRVDPKTGEATLIRDLPPAATRAAVAPDGQTVLLTVLEKMDVDLMSLTEF